MRVYYVSGYANEVYYVRAKDEEAAKALLLKEIGKYVFKNNLRDDETIVMPEKLGSNVIVEHQISKGTLEADLDFEDITATAYIFSQNGMDHWKDWKITTTDIIGDKHVAESLEEIMFTATEEDDV